MREPREVFHRHSINYLPAEKSKSDLYLDFLPLVNSAAVDLLDNDRMLAPAAAFATSSWAPRG
jgi:hypothetical protein